MSNLNEHEQTYDDTPPDPLIITTSFVVLGTAELLGGFTHGSSFDVWKLGGSLLDTR
jgi:hypothetical protein